MNRYGSFGVSTRHLEYRVIPAGNPGKATSQLNETYHCLRDTLFELYEKTNSDC